MSKIFRIHKNGPNTFDDWYGSKNFPYNSTNRDTITDPNGASPRHEITSIPSPFARIDLVKTAFREVCRSGDLGGDTIFHKMVSDALDVGEIFFNIDKFSDKIEILSWNPGTMIPALVNSNNAGHRYFGDALDKYMKSDGATYNFGALNNIYLLNYISGPTPLNIIGATSPATLFFSSANDLSYVKDIQFGQDIPFDGNFQPLYKRDFEFVKYFFALRNSNDNFVKYFPEIDSYLELTYSAVADDKRTELGNITMGDLQFSPISVYDGGQLNQVDALGIILMQKGRSNPGQTSGFAMNSTRVPIANIPLVLPIVSGGMYSNLKYTTDDFGNDSKAPSFDPESDINKRRLPVDRQVYPYLTISDFLEDTIIKVPHKLNVKNYFDGIVNNNDTRDYSYLLPIKPLFFEYFTTEELRGVLPDRKPMIEISNRASGVTVTLRIPIRGSNGISYIEYSRTYYEDTKADAANNRGAVANFEFTGFVMPQIRFVNAEDAIYNISSIQPQSERIGFEFYSIEDGRYIQSQHTCRDRNGMFRIDNYLIEGSNFNYIRVSQNQTSGILLPIFKEQRSIEHFEFAIDLGTSNTHIEYRKRRRDGSSLSEAFTYDLSDRQLCEMFIGTDLGFQTELIEKDFIPAKLGNGDFRFPTRTVLSSARTIDWQRDIAPFTLVNLPFTYDKRGDLEYNDYLCNIKWGSENKEMEAYVRCLMLIIRNKVLMNDGILGETRITWFYPISMSPSRLRRLRDAWDESFHKYFGQGTTICMTESAAPINYFFNVGATTHKLVNIDIGGGTTDVAFATDNRIDHVTSFHFASNTLFEDSLADSTENGIVDWHKDRFLRLFEKANAHELRVAYMSSNNRNPANMASFLFGLKGNSVLKNAGIGGKEFDFNNILKEDEDFKIVFVVFYTAIIYHIAQIVKALKMEVPRHISFSGNGSKVVNIIADERTLVGYTKLVFEKVLGRPCEDTLEFLGIGNESNSKESTCKGGIMDVPDGNNNAQTIVLKSDSSGIVTSSDTYAALTDAYKSNTVSEVSRFFDFVLKDLNREFNFNNNFGVTRQSIEIATSVVNEMRNSDFMTFLGRGIDQHMLDIDDRNSQIGESFFFYPIKGALQAISSRIFNSLNE